MQCSVHSKCRGPNIEPCWLLQVHGLKRSNLTLKHWHYLLQHAHIPTCNHHQIHGSMVFDGIFKLAIIYRRTDETRMLLLLALEYKDGAQNISNCSCTQKRCLARSLSAVPHGQRVWLSDKPAWLRRGILYFFPSVSPVFFPLPFQSIPISVKSAVTFSFFHFQIPTSHQLF